MDSEHVADIKNWFPILRAMMFKTDPRMSEDIPMIHCGVQKIKRPFRFSSFSLLIWAYFISTSPRELKKLPPDARRIQYVVSATFGLLI